MTIFEKALYLSLIILLQSRMISMDQDLFKDAHSPPLDGLSSPSGGDIREFPNKTWSKLPAREFPNVKQYESEFVKSDMHGVELAQATIGMNQDYHAQSAQLRNQEYQHLNYQEAQS